MRSSIDTVISIEVMCVIATGFVVHSRFSIEEEEWPCRTAGIWSGRFNDEQVYMDTSRGQIPDRYHIVEQYSVRWEGEATGVVGETKVL